MFVVFIWTFFPLVLPRKKQMLFLCGVEVEVSFSALYTNVLVVFATLKSMDSHTQDCTVTLSSLPVSIYLCALFIAFGDSFRAATRPNLLEMVIINCIVTHNIFFSLSFVWLSQVEYVQMLHFPSITRNYSMVTFVPAFCCFRKFCPYIDFLFCHRYRQNRM